MSGINGQIDCVHSNSITTLSNRIYNYIVRAECT